MAPKEQRFYGIVGIMASVGACFQLLVYALMHPPRFDGELPKD